MTREEAITVLKAFMENPLFNDVHKAAFNIAIHDIKQESCEDCISREEAIDELELQAKEMSQWSERYTEQAKGVLTAKNIIKDLSPVRPQPKTGRWIDDKCSACGKGIEDLIASLEWYRDEKPNFCPFCGLKLVDSQESEGEV